MFTLLCIYVFLYTVYTHAHVIYYIILIVCILIFLSYLISLIYKMNVIKLTKKYGY